MPCISGPHKQYVLLCAVNHVNCSVKTNYFLGIIRMSLENIGGWVGGWEAATDQTTSQEGRHCGAKLHLSESPALAARPKSAIKNSTGLEDLTLRTSARRPVRPLTSSCSTRTPTKLFSAGHDDVDDGNGTCAQELRNSRSGLVQVLQGN